MNVPKEIRRAWKRNYSHGDLEKIKEATGLATRTSHRAIVEGKCSPETMEKITRYFKEKKRGTKELIEQTLEDLN